MVISIYAIVIDFSYHLGYFIFLTDQPFAFKASLLPMFVVFFETSLSFWVSINTIDNFDTINTFDTIDIIDTIDNIYYRKYHKQAPK